MYVSKYSSIDLSGTKNLHKLATLPAHFLISQPQRAKTFFPGLFKNSLWPSDVSFSMRLE